MLRIVSPGSFRKTRSFLDKLNNGDVFRGLDQFGKRGVRALEGATPKRTGTTAESWTYGIERSRGQVTIFWTNTNENRGAKIAVLIQYGHGTGTGGYVSGIDYINPALRPVFDSIANDVWKRVTNG